MRLKSFTKTSKVLIMLLIPFVVFLLSIKLGRYNISFEDIFNLLVYKIYNKPLNEEMRIINTIIFKARLPRVLAAMLIGSSLSLSGTAYQSIFKNPMVSPAVLGVSNGAGFGAAIGILLSFNSWWVQISSFLFGILAVVITFAISRSFNRKCGSTIMLILAGMVVGTIFSSLISLTKYIADPEGVLPSITFWLMGSLSSITLKDVQLIIIPILLGTIPLVIMRWKFNILAFGDEEAHALGINTKRIRMIIIACSTIITASSISISGIIGWVGLIIPHITRLWVGPNHSVVIPASIVIGASYLMIIDDVARSISTIEIPLGILTSLMGAPFFLYLLMKKRRA